MRNNIIYTIFSILIIGSFAACDDFLNEKPQTDFMEEGSESGNLVSKYLSPADAESGLAGAYLSFKGDIYQQEIFMINDVQSDNCYVGGDGPNEEAIDLVMRLTATNSKVASIWRLYSGMAGSATDVIENTRLMEEGTIIEDERRRIMAEAKFIRAWAYFDMVRIWGDFPMVLELIPTITAENLETWYPVMYPARTPEADVYAQILDDLDEENTIAWLNSKNSGAFQATKGAAYGLLAKIAATIGPKSSRDYGKVVSYCDKVIAEKYDLIDNFDDLWNPDNKYTRESIFEVFYNSTSPNWAHWTLLKEYDDGTVTWRRYCTPTHEFIGKFDKENDIRYAASVIWKTAPYDVYYPADNYPFSYKVREKSSNIILMRLADILLLKAEALVELNRPDEAIEIVNKIRKRAGLDALESGMSQNDARLAVESERQLELYMEGQRWFDLLRNDRMLDVMKRHKNENGEYIFANIQSFRTKWPIPQGEIDKNERLVQNVGY